MKKIIYLFLVVLVMDSCDRPDKNESYTETYNETKNLSEIFGIFDLKPGVTDAKYLKNNFKSEYAYDALNSNFYNGFYNLKDFESSKKIEKYPRIKQYYYSEYRYKDLSVHSVSIFMLDDTLIGINVRHPDFGLSGSFDLKKEFIGKYGEGIGKKESEYTLRWDKNKKDYYLFDSYTKESRIWENEKIIAEYDYKDGLTIKLKNKYPLFDSLVKRAIKIESEKKDSEVKSNINSSI